MKNIPVKLLIKQQIASCYDLLTKTITRKIKVGNFKFLDKAYFESGCIDNFLIRASLQCTKCFTDK